MPAVLAWLRDEAGLRPPAIARVVGVGPAVLARWVARGESPASEAPGADPTLGEVPLLVALDCVHALACWRYPDPTARRRWWVEGRRDLGWLLPAEVLRRGRFGEVLVLLADA